MSTWSIELAKLTRSLRNVLFAHPTWRLSYRLSSPAAVMTSQQIQTLLAPPNIEEARQKTVFLLNSRFQSLDDLEDLDSLVSEAKRHNDELQARVRP
jgi:hypothetical protein